MLRSTRSLARHLPSPAQWNPSPASRSLRLYNPNQSPQWPAAAAATTIRLLSGNNRTAGGDPKDPPPPKPQVDPEAERRAGEQILKPSETGVSSESSTRKRFENSAAPAPDNESVNEGFKHDVNILKDTFRLDRIPRESHILGLAGTIPYFATSLSTLFLGWNLKKELPTGNSFYDSILVDQGTAQYLLSIIEPLQLGYGAVIISFLGAIHWGLEYAEKQPLRDRTRFRYGMGVAASVVAWPTVLMPIEYGLTSQFMAFVALYFADAKASSRGWAPKWYGQYRFMLTALVGLAIFVSLVGRSEMEKSERLSKQHLRSTMNRPGLADNETNWAKIEAEEKEKEQKQKQKQNSKAQKDKSGKDEAKGKGEDGESASERGSKGEGKSGENEKDSKDDRKSEQKEQDKEEVNEAAKKVKGKKEN